MSDSPLEESDPQDPLPQDPLSSLHIGELTSRYVSDLHAALDKWHRDQQLVFEQREVSLQQREHDLAEAQRALVRGESKLTEAWEEFHTEREALTEATERVFADQKALEELSARLNQQGLEQQELAEQNATMVESIQTREARLEVAERAVQQGEVKLIAGWESLAQEQQKFSEYSQRDDIRRTQASLSERAAEVVHWEQGVAETAQKLASAMAAFHPGQQTQLDQRLAELERREKQVALAEAKLGCASGSLDLNESTAQ